MSSRGTIRRPRLVVAGNPEQVGRHLADARRQEYQAFVVTSRPPEACGATAMPGEWLAVDLDDGEQVAAAFREIAAGGPVDVVVYVGAAPRPGASAEQAARPLAHVLAACREVAPHRFVLARREPAGGEDPERLAVERAEDEILARDRGSLPAARLRFAPRPRLVLTGASGFIGKHLIASLQEDFEVVAMARSSQSYCGVPSHPNLSWVQIDLRDRAAVASAFARLREGGGAEFVVHLAAYYDFTGAPHPDYQRTNVDALRSVLEECRTLGLRRFVFASSLAASDFPRGGRRLDEASAADGPHPYAQTKKRGEELLREFPEVPSVVVRLAAIYSDWLEYPPLFVSFERWRSTAWDRGILGGRGRFAIPYLHVQDVQAFLVALLDAEALAPAEVLIASPDEPTSLRWMFERVARGEDGSLPPSPSLPAPLCFLGMVARDLVGRAMGSRPFERPWMATYIDRTMPVDARRTRERLAWAPRERLSLERRLPLVLQNRVANPSEWHRRNQAVLQRDRSGRHLELDALLERSEAELVRRIEAVHRTSQPPDDWAGKIAFGQLRAAVRNRDAFGFANFCGLLADRRFDQGALPAEVDLELRLLGETCQAVIAEVARAVPGSAAETAALRARLQEIVALQVRLGRDQIEERYEELRLHPQRRHG